MIVAALAGIRVFATGGIGGVHRGAERSWDVSADLEELAATSVAVVCAGAKAILDLSKTLEYLETKGVPVVGYGTDELPAFYTSSSGLRLEERADRPEEIARLMKAKWDLGLDGGIVVANPVPQRYSMDRLRIDTAIGQALGAAEAAHIRGKEVTPFLLAKVKELTGGDSLEANTPPDISPEPLKLQSLKFREFFQWLSNSMKSASRSNPGDRILLAPPSGWSEI